MQTHFALILLIGLACVIFGTLLHEGLGYRFLEAAGTFQVCALGGKFDGNRVDYVLHGVSVEVIVLIIILGVAGHLLRVL